jgi:hypothetical protein
LFILQAAMTDITLEKLRQFSSASSTMVTADAPLFGVVMILNGRVLARGSQDAGSAGASVGFPPRDQVVAEASRFWIQHDNGVRERKSREEMARMLRDHQRAAGAS